MSKMKHLLRKLHIGIDHNPHQHLHHHASAAATSPGQPTSSSLSPSSPPSDSSSASSLSTTAERGLVGRGRATDLIDRTERDSGLPMQESPYNHTDSALDFNSVEEEFQVQLALALSASDSEGRKAEDPESDQINAARQLSLGCPLSVADSERLGEFLSLKYWNYNVVHYDEKIVDGFYDVYAIQSRSTFQGQLPLLVDLQAVSILDNVDHEVILVNRSIDSQLRCLENKAYALSRECGVLGPSFLLNGVIQRLADLVVDCLGGPVGNAEEITKKWRARNVELRSSLSTIVLPLGFLNIGLSRHRALLFKVLADRINLPCMLVKGSLYTGSDDGAVNLIKTVDGSEYIIDLMGAPGALIPAEIPSSFLLDSILGAKVVPDNGDILNNFRFNLNGTASTLPPLEEDPAACRLTLEAAKSLDTQSPEADNILFVTKEDVRSEEFDKHVQPDDGLCITVSSKTEELSTVQEKRVKDVSKYVISAAKNPEFAQKLHAVLLESGASPPPDLFTGMNPASSSERKLIEQIQAVEGEINCVKVSSSPNQYWSNNELSLLPPSGAQLLDIIGFADNIEHEYVGPAMQLVANPMDGQSCCQINQEGVWGFAAEVNNILSDDLKVDPPCGVDVHETEMCLAENEPGRLPSFKLTGRVDEGLGAHTILSDNKEINPLFGEVADWEIPWEDLEIGDRVGIGSYGEVYHGDWNGTEVAVKKFLVQDFSRDVLLQFKCEAELMIRLTHPNVVLFMGAVTRPPHLSILTEYLPRGSLYRLLHRSNAQIDDTRRMKMALDVAKGMNYLHTSHPTIVHRDLKTPNLLVDNNWVVKVCDFGLSRLKHRTFLSSKSTAGTPEWMAPEVLRNERASEKCDVYSFGVILWELATLQMPWSGLNPMQVVGAVGFQHKRLEIPSEVDPSVAQIIRDCWENDPSLRPTFSQLISRLRGLKRLVQILERSECSAQRVKSCKNGCQQSWLRLNQLLGFVKEEDYIQSMLDGDLCWFIRSGDSAQTPISMEPMENPQIEQLRKVAGEDYSNGGK